MVTTQSERTFGVSCIIKFFLRLVIINARKWKNYEYPKKGLTQKRMAFRYHLEEYKITIR